MTPDSTKSVSITVTKQTPPPQHSSFKPTASKELIMLGTGDMTGNQTVKGNNNPNYNTVVTAGISFLRAWHRVLLRVWAWASAGLKGHTWAEALQSIEDGLNKC